MSDTVAFFASNRFDTTHPYREDSLYTDGATFARLVEVSAGTISGSYGWGQNRAAKIYFEAYAEQAKRSLLEIAPTGADLEEHESHMENSPYYAAVFTKHGHQLPRALAEVICHTHGTALEELEEAGGIEYRATIPTLELLQALGY